MPIILYIIAAVASKLTDSHMQRTVSLSFDRTDFDSWYAVFCRVLVYSNTSHTLEYLMLFSGDSLEFAMYKSDD